MAGNLVISQINGGPIGVINAIINGNFQVNQRGVSGTVTLAAGAYGHDRWKAGASGCTYTFATSNNVTTLTISAGSLIQVIEGINLYSGTYTLSWTGTAQGKIGAGSYSGSGVTGTATGGTNLNIEFNTGTVSLVQFEPGVEASPFERRDYGRELMMCQRYLPAFNSTGTNTYIASCVATSTTNARVFVPFLVQVRTPPTGISVSAASHLGFTGVLNATASVVAIVGVTQPTNCGAFDFTTTGLTAGQAGAAYFNNAAGQLLFTGCEL
jgi:hypothetical protein